jgi:hypothetical protein
VFTNEEGGAMVAERTGVAGMRWGPVAAASGAASALLALLAFLIAQGPDDTDSLPSILGYFAAHDDRVRWQAVLFGLATALLLWFAATLASASRAAEAEAGLRYGGVILASAGATVALYLVGIVGWFALAEQFGGARGVPPASPPLGDAATLWNLADAAYTLANFPAAVFVAAGAVAALNSRLTGGWLAGIGGAIALLLLVNGVAETLGDADILGELAFFAFLAWIFAASVVLTVSARRLTNA